MMLRCAAVIAAGLVPLALIEDPSMARAVALVCLAMSAWILEVVPPFVPTLALLAAAPLALPALDLKVAMGWTADPLLALFFGGFALSAAAAATGLDQRMAQIMVHLARGSARGLVVTTTLGGFVTSMWMSNAAAAGVQLAALRPLLGEPTALRSALLLAVAMGTNFGGMGTPIGSGPNAIAIAAMTQPISFIQWMTLGLPLAALLVIATITIIIGSFRVAGPIGIPAAPREPLDRRQRALVVLFACAVIAWLTEPLHGVGAASVALALSALLFATRLLEPKHLGLIDWSTLLLIAGGLVAGRILERSGALPALAAHLPLAEMPPAARSLVAVGIAALLSALMSNTATAVVLIPLMSALDPSPAMPILIAMGCALGVPFAISTPPNAMVVGAGASPRDLLRVGLPLMIGGIVLVALTGPWVLARFGIR